MREAGDESLADGPVEVVVQLRPAAAAAALRAGADTSPEAQALLAAAEAEGIALSPVHPEADDAASASYYRFEARDLKEARRIVEALLATEAVETAYPKPRAYPPG